MLKLITIHVGSRKGVNMVNDSFFLNAEDRTITMVKGDTMAFNFQVQGLEGSPDAIAFTCKEHYDDATPLFTSAIGNGVTLIEYDEAKDLATYCVRVDPTKTEDLDLASYYYDLQLKKGQDVLTLLRGRLNLIYSVTD